MTVPSPTASGSRPPTGPLGDPPTGPDADAPVHLVANPPEVVVPHPAAQLFPDLGEVEFDELVADIAAHGLRQPIALTPDGRLLDGRHRHRACELAGVAARWETVTAEPWRYVLSVNLHRRHLTDSQRAMIAAQIADRAPGQYDRGANPSYEGFAPTQGETCELLQISHGAMVRARRVHTAGTAALASGVRAGAIPLTTASRVARELPPESQDAYAVAVTEHGADPVRAAPAAPVYGTLAAAPPSAPSTVPGATEAANDASVDATPSTVAGTSESAASTATPSGSRPAQTRRELAGRVRELAGQGCSSRQIAAATSTGVARVREIARDEGIDLRADRVLGRTRRVDPARVLRETVAGLDALCPGADLVGPEDLAELDPDTAGEWAESMTQSLRRLTRLRRQLQSHASQHVPQLNHLDPAPGAVVTSTEGDRHV